MPPTPSNTTSQNDAQIYPFPSTIYISPTPTAAHFALHTYQRPPPCTLVLWADGSASDTHLGAPYAGAIGYHEPCTGLWREHTVVRFSSSTVSMRLVNQAELLALSEGFRAAVAQIEHVDCVLLFSDSQAVLQRLAKKEGWVPDARAWSDLLACANTLYDAGVAVEVHWVPGKACVEGHQRVDELARDYRRLVQRVRPRGLVCCAETMGEVRIGPGEGEGEVMGLLRGVMRRWGMFKGEKGECGDKVEREKREERAEMKEARAKRRAEVKAVKAERVSKRVEKGKRREEKKEMRRLLQLKRRKEAMSWLLKRSEALEFEAAQMTVLDDVDFVPPTKPRQENPSIPLLETSS